MRKTKAITALLTGLTLLLAACAGTRVAEMGRLPNRDNLVTLVVSEDRAVIEQHCQGALAAGPIYGCQVTRYSPLADGSSVRLIKIVRYTDRLPSPMALEIDVHELCHAVASLQSVPDPCHVGNNGFLQTAPRAIMRIH
ncbi:MAG: hypothetical protein HYU51_06615 [Candidatus Rokubacteria bacterium]|nr:hypothetical protein [Candidatus Rokubacteria bacterium]